MTLISFYLDNDQYWDITPSFSNEYPFKAGDILEVQLELIPFHIVKYTEKNERRLTQRKQSAITQFIGSIKKTYLLEDGSVINILLDCNFPVRLHSNSISFYSTGDTLGGFGCLMGIISFDKFTLSSTVKGKVTNIDTYNSEYVDLKTHLITIEVSKEYSILEPINRISIIE